MVKALLDSGAADSLVMKDFVKKLRAKNSSQSWSAPWGELETSQIVKAQFTMPELQDDYLIEWNLHVTNTLGANDVIIRWDLLKFLGIDIHFSDNSIKWGSSSMSFKDADSTVMDAYFVQEAKMLKEATKCAKRIFGAKHEPADLDDHVQEWTAYPQWQREGLFVEATSQVWRSLQQTTWKVDRFSHGTTIE